MVSACRTMQRHALSAKAQGWLILQSRRGVSKSQIAHTAVATVILSRGTKIMYEIEIVLLTDEKPTVQDVLDYINELGEDLDFTVKAAPPPRGAQVAG